jgi:hypothetical protein
MLTIDENTIKAVAAFLIYIITAIVAYFAGKNPPTPHTCPDGQHWDESLQECVDDEPTPGPQPNPGPDAYYVDNPIPTPVETLTIAYEGTTTPIGDFTHTNDLPGGVYLNESGYAAIDLGLYEGYVDVPIKDGHDNRTLLLIGDQETSTARYDATDILIATNVKTGPESWYESAKKGEQGYGAKIIILKRKIHGY